MENKIENRVDKIINSFDGIQLAEVPPYFYTRLRARMQSELEDKTERPFLLKPAFLAATLSILLIVNVVFLFQFNNRGTNGPTDAGKAATIESFADAYGLNNSTVYE